MRGVFGEGWYWCEATGVGLPPMEIETQALARPLMIIKCRTNIGDGSRRTGRDAFS